LFWGIVAYAVLGVGIYFAYFEYVVKPTRAAERARQAEGKDATTDPAPTPPVERPEMFLEHAAMEPLRVGELANIRVSIKNAGKVNAYKIRIRTALSYVNPKVAGPLVDFYAPNLVMPEPIRFDLLPAQERIYLNPKSTIPVTEKALEQLNDRSRLMVFTGIGDYEDANGSGYSFAYCYMYHSEAGPSFLIQCPSEYWPRDSEGKAEADPEKRAWMIIDEMKIEGFEIENLDGFYMISVTMSNVGDLPAIIKNTKLTARVMDRRFSYTREMTMQDIDDTNVTHPPGNFPVSAIPPHQKITIPIEGGPLTKELFLGVLSGTVFLHLLGGVEYETHGAARYHVFCAIYEPHVKKFIACGGGTG
jgi:hypothetical protein